MKHLLLSVMCLFPCVALAQEEKQCLHVDEAYNFLSEDYGEEMIVAGHGEESSVQFWLNTDKPSWSVLVVTDDEACLVASGEDWTFGPITNKPNL